METGTPTHVGTRQECGPFDRRRRGSSTQSGHFNCQCRWYYYCYGYYYSHYDSSARSAGSEARGRCNGTTYDEALTPLSCLSGALGPSDTQSKYPESSVGTPPGLGPGGLCRAGVPSGVRSPLLLPTGASSPVPENTSGDWCGQGVVDPCRPSSWVVSDREEESRHLLHRHRPISGSRTLPPGPGPVDRSCLSGPRGPGVAFGVKTSPKP